MSDDMRIAGMFAGFQVALLSFAETLEAKEVVTRDELAEGLRATAVNIPETPVQAFVVRALQLLADELARPVDPDPAEMRRRMFRLIQGRKMNQEEPDTC